MVYLAPKILAPSGSPRDGPELALVVRSRADMSPIEYIRLSVLGDLGRHERAIRHHRPDHSASWAVDLIPSYPEQHDHQAVTGDVLADRLNPLAHDNTSLASSTRRRAPAFISAA